MDLFHVDPLDEDWPFEIDQQAGHLFKHPEQEHALYADPTNQEPQGPAVRRRSKLSAPVPVRLPVDVLQQVRDRAAGDDRFVSQWIRRAVERELARANG